MREIIAWLSGNIIAIVVGLIVGVKYNEKCSKLYADVKKLATHQLDDSVQFLKDLF